PLRELRFRDVDFAYPGGQGPHPSPRSASADHAGEPQGRSQEPHPSPRSASADHAGEPQGRSQEPHPSPRSASAGHAGEPQGRSDGRLILRGFNLTVPAGSSLAIVGRNGAGKTTLAKLICRLYDPSGGAIEVDGEDIRDIDV